MRQLQRALLACVLTVAGATSAHAQQVEPIEMHLENGMTFLLLPRDEQPNVITAGWVARVGSANEAPGITGVSHFLEHLMFKGTDVVGTADPDADREFRVQQDAARHALREAIVEENIPRYMRGEINDPWDAANDTPTIREKRSELTRLMDEQKTVTINNDFDRIYTGAGATGMNAGTGKDYTVYYINIPSNKLELWAWMESDRLGVPTLREFDAERDVVIEERRQQLESRPTGRLDERFDAMFWLASPYSWPIIGWPSNMKSWTREAVQSYYDTYYQPSNLTGVIVGDFDPSEARSLVEQYFGRLENRADPAPPMITYEIERMGETRFYGECDCQPQVEVRYHGVPFGHQDMEALEVLAAIMNGRTGRLYESLVEDLRIASDASASNNSAKYDGSFSFSATVKGSTTPDELERALYDEIRRLQDEPVSERELQKVKNQFAADVYRGLRTNTSLFFQLAIYASYGDWEMINEIPERVREVTAEDVQRVANEYLTDDNKAVAIYTRRESAGGATEMTLDEALASVPEAARAMVRAQIEPQLAELEAETDLAALESALEQTKTQATMVPEQFRGLMGFVQKKIEDRIAAVRAAGGEGE